MLRFYFLVALIVSFQTIAETKEKLVSAGGTLTELIYALGADDQLVAVDQSSLYPLEARELPSVGYYREMSAEGVLSTGLDRLFALEGSGRDTALKQIQAAGVPINHYNKITTIDGLFAMIDQLGNDLGKQDRAAELIKEIKQSLPAKATVKRGRALFLLSSGERGVIAAGKETVPQMYFDYLGIENVAKHDGFKGIGLESLAISQPTILIAPAHTVRGIGGAKAFCSQPQLALLTAAQKCNLLVMDSLLALGVTPRMATGLKTIKDYLNTKL
jgi:iron complex transport system substrate-binding protein